MAACLVAGCTTPRIDEPGLSAERSAAHLIGRSLDDPALHRYLAENLGRDPGETWDFESLSWTAFYFHPSLAVARAQWETALAVEQTASRRPNPVFTFTPGYNFTREAGLSPWMPAVNLDFLFPTAGKRGYEQAIARSGAESARLSVMSASWQVRSDLRRALIDAAHAARRDSALRAQAGSQKQLLSLLEERYAAGSIAAPEVSVARHASLLAESAAADARGQARLARARVATAAGLPPRALDNVSLPPPPAAPPLTRAALDEARRESLQSRADVLAALARYHAAHAALALEVARATPDLHLGPGYQWDQGANKWTLAFAFELPLFHRNQALIAEANARRAEAAAQFDVVQSQALAAIDLAIAAQDAAALQLDHAQRLRAEVGRQQALLRQRQELGAADQVELQTAALDLATVDVALLEAENAAAIAAGQLEDALQLPFPHLEMIAAAAPKRSARTP